MKLGLIGAGNMASALARGIGEPVLVHDVDEAKARALAEELGGEAVGSNAELAERADAVVLCHKPKQLDEVAEQVGGRARAVVSILAATSTERLAAAYPGAPVYRFIPNMPVELRRGGRGARPRRGRRPANGRGDDGRNRGPTCGPRLRRARPPLPGGHPGRHHRARADR